MGQTAQNTIHLVFSPGRGVHLYKVCDEVGEPLDHHVGERGLHYHWRRALGKLHRLNVHRLGRGQAQLGDPCPHQGSQILQCLQYEIILQDHLTQSAKQINIYLSKVYHGKE